MTLQHFYKVFLLALYPCLFVACARENPIPPPSLETPDLQITMPKVSPLAPTETEFPITSLPAVTLSPTPPVSDLLSFIPSIPVEAVSEETDEEIVEKLLTQWLNYFKTLSSDSQAKLEAYEIHEVEIHPELQYLAAELSEAFVARVVFSVKPVHSPAPDWLAGNGSPVDDNNWIDDKSLYIIVLKSENSYILEFWGTSP